jgi:hypothetical protein
MADPKEIKNQTSIKSDVTAEEAIKKLDEIKEKELEGVSGGAADYSDHWSQPL